jgi:PAS domain-containing protein
MLKKSAELSSIGFAAIDNAGIITEANSAFCDLFALAAPEGLSLTEQVATQFHSSIVDLIQALKCPDAAILELKLKRDSEPLFLHIAKDGGDLRMLVVDRNQ